MDSLWKGSLPSRILTRYVRDQLDSVYSRRPFDPLLDEILAESRMLDGAGIIDDGAGVA
jgi:hypothetical protein